MDKEKKSVAYYVCRMVLRPLASILLKCGMTWKEFSELSKSVFVEAASAEFGIKGRPTNISRVSILTGISRKEVKRQRDLLASDEPPVQGKTTDATRVLSGWFQDADFLDANSEPMLLSESGPLPNFEMLCDRYSGDIATPTMLKELLQTETIERTEDGRLRVIRRFYQPAMHDDESLTWAVSMIRDLANTMNNNVFLTDKTQPRFGRKAENVSMPATAVAEFRDYLDSRGQSFLEDIDSWLTQHEANGSARRESLVRLGIGMFAIEDKFSEEKIQ